MRAILFPNVSYIETHVSKYVQRISFNSPCLVSTSHTTYLNTHQRSNPITLNPTFVAVPSALLHKKPASTPANPANPRTYFPISIELPALVVIGFADALALEVAFAALDEEDADDALEEPTTLEVLFAALDAMRTTTLVLEALVEVEVVMVPLDGLVLLGDVAGMREAETLVDALLVCEGC